MKILNIQNNKIFNNKAKSFGSKQKLEEPEKQKNIETYAILAPITTLVGALHGVYNKINSAGTYDVIVKEGEGDKAKILLIEGLEKLEKKCLAIRVRLSHFSEKWQIAECEEPIVQKEIKNIIEHTVGIEPDKPKLILNERDPISYFKKIIDPAEKKFLDSLKKVKILEPLIDKYNNSNKELISIGRKIFINKGLALKGACVGLTLGVMEAYFTNLISSKLENKKKSDETLDMA